MVIAILCLPKWLPVVVKPSYSYYPLTLQLICGTIGHLAEKQPPLLWDKRLNIHKRIRRKNNPAFPSKH